MIVPNWIVKRLEEWNKLASYKKTKTVKKGKSRFNVPTLGFDTETLDGYAKLVACSDGKYVYFKTLENSNFEKILKFLTRKKYASTLNFFYNIDYDVAAIIKYLPRKNVEEIAQLSRTSFGEYVINYLPRKALIIKKGKNKWYYFDLWQYYRSSLATAAEKYLNNVTKDKMDRERLGTDEEYWRKNVRRIVEYCIKDCQITASLAQILQEKLNSIGLSFDKPYSPGSISTRYFAQNYEFPPFKPTEWNKYAYLSYYGGRFEVIQKGYFDYLIVQDINSAYPYQISKLIDLKNGVWQHVTDFVEDADLGFYKVIVEKTNDEVIQPFCFRDRGLVFYPKMRDVLHFTTQDELLFAIDHCDVEVSVVDGWVFHAKEITYPFKHIEKIYEERKKLKKNDPVMQLVLKIIMNSWYGKTAEKKKRYELADLDEADDFLMTDYTPVKTSVKPGLVFNPVYASLITARTRIELLKTALRHEDEVVAMFTDSVISTKKIVEPNDALGGWSVEIEGEGLIVGCGVYTIRNESRVKTRVRGMHLENSVDLIELAKQYADRDKIDFTWVKSVRPKEVLNFKRIYTIEDINRFITYTKELNVRMDKKRVWFDDPQTFGELLNDCYFSSPLVVSK